MNEKSPQKFLRFYPPHHFIFLPACALLLLYGGYRCWTDESLVWGLFSLSVFLILYLALMLRQHYALSLQDRIVVLEFRVRYAEHFDGRSEDIVRRLSFAQIASLRFCGESQFAQLLQKTLDENLSPEDIRKNIESWREDKYRV